MMTEENPQEIFNITNFQELLHDYNQACDDSLFISFLMQCQQTFDSETKKPKTIKIEWEEVLIFVFKLYNTKKKGNVRIYNYFFDGIEDNET